MTKKMHSRVKSKANLRLLKRKLEEKRLREEVEKPIEKGKRKTLLFIWTLVLLLALYNIYKLFE